MKKKIFILLGHPDEESYCGAIARAYEAGAREGGHEVRVISLQKMNFDANLAHGYNAIQELEPDLRGFQENIQWAEHIVLVYPLWWALFPAKLKGLFDRALLPGFGYRFHKTDPFWDKLLRGRSARLIVTTNTPNIYYWVFFAGLPGVRVMKKAVLDFCGIGPIRVSVLSRVLRTSEERRARFVERIRKMGVAGK